MAICSINMTVENRRDFAAMAMFLHMLLAGAGAMLVYCYFVMRSLLQELNGLLYEHYKSIYVESAIVIGLVMILVHGYGVKMCLHVGNWKKLYHKAFSWKVMMYVFLTVTLIMLGGIITFLVVTANQDDNVIVAGTGAMNDAIKQYRTNIVVKTAVDRVQLKNECCGSVTYVEWFNTQWTDDAYVSREVSPEARMYSFPFSCCNRHSERPCINVDVNNERSHFQYNPNTDVTVYRVGCNVGITRRIREVVFAKLRLYGWIAFVLELVAFVLFRYVQTSTDVALTWANPTLICPGYLINLGAPVVPLDKTTNIEEFRRQQEKLEETIAMEEDMKLKDDEAGDDEEPVSRWHKSKKKKENRTTNNWNDSERRHELDVVFAGHSSNNGNNNSATSAADNSDDEEATASARRRGGGRGPRRRSVRNQRPINVTASNRNDDEAADENEDTGDSEDDEGGEAGVADIEWENELKDRPSRRSLPSTKVAGKPPLPPAVQRRLSADVGGPQPVAGAEPPQVAATVLQHDPVAQQAVAGSTDGRDDSVPLAPRKSRIPIYVGSGNLSAPNVPPATADVPQDMATGGGSSPVANYLEPGADPGDVEPDTGEPYDDFGEETDMAEEMGEEGFDMPYDEFDGEEMDMAAEGDGEEALDGEGDDAAELTKDDKERRRRDTKDRSGDRKKSRDRKDRKSGSRKRSIDRRRSDSRKGKDRKRGADKSRSRDRKSHSRDRKGGKDSKRRKSRDSKGRTDRKRDSSKEKGRGRKSDRKGGGDKKRGDRSTSKNKKDGGDTERGDRSTSKDKKDGGDKEREDRSASKDKKHGRDKKENEDRKGRSKAKGGGRRSKSGGKKKSPRDKKKERPRGGNKGGRSSDGRKSGRKKKDGGHKSKDKKKGGRSPGDQKSGGKRKGGSPSPKIKKGMKKLRRR